MVSINLKKTGQLAHPEGNILIVGGYGGVGRTVSKRLATAFPGRVIGAGRSMRKAEALSHETGGNILPLALDLNNLGMIERVLEGVELVVMCVDQQERSFVEACIQRGIHYVDITAGDTFLSSVEDFDQEARLSGSTVVLSVGLSPGLTNLLASHAKKMANAVKRIDIFILLGLGENHGEAAVRWTVENLATEFWVHEGADLRKVRSFHEARVTHFPGDLGRRQAYRFNFPDQHAIRRTLNLEAASSWLCFESAFVTTLLAAGARTGLTRLASLAWVREGLVRMMRSVHFGSDIFVLQARAFSELKGELPIFESTLQGHGEGRATGIVATKVVDRLLRYDFAPGVFHIEQLIEPAPFLSELVQEGYVWSG